MIRKFALAAVFCTIALAGYAQTLPQGARKIASMGGITQYNYPNGLKVLLYPDQAQPKITVNVTYLVGSRHEGYGETGMAHLLEHVNFIETTTGRKIKEELVTHGANWNGTTSVDRTNYFETFTASDDNLLWALNLETDRMVNVKFTKQRLDIEMTVVRNEFERGENDPVSILQQRVAATAYLWHNYGKSTIGSKEDIERVPVERLAAFYSKFYQPDNAVLVITGRIDETKTLQMVAESMGKLPRPTRVLDQTYTVEPPQDGERFVTLRRVGQEQTLMMAYHVVAASHPDAAALQVLAAVMNGAGPGGRGGGQRGANREGRLAKALVDTNLAQSSDMALAPFHDPGLLQVRAVLNKDQSLDAARDAILKALDDIVKNPPSPPEVESARTQLRRELENNLSDPQAIATGALTAAIAQGDWRLMFLRHDRLADVSAADVVRVAKAYLKPSNRTVGYFIPDTNPDRTVVPPVVDLASTLDNYKNSVTVARAESFDPTIDNIDSRIGRTQLANGMRIAVLSKTTANNMVTAMINLRFGDETSLTDQTTAARFAANLLMQGTKTLTRQQIQDEFRKLNAQVNVGIGALPAGQRGAIAAAQLPPVNNVTASITAPAQNFPAAVRLAVEILREPAYPQDEFDRLKSQRLMALAVAPTEPNQLAGDRLDRYLTPFAKGDGQYTPTREELLSEVQARTLDDVREFHEQFYGANYGVFAVVGPISVEDVQRTAAELLGSWNTSKAYKPLITPFKKMPPINEKIETPDKANALFLVGQRVQMSQDDADYPAMVLAGYMWGGSITSRVSDRIRNREGLSYGANSGFNVPAEGDSALLQGQVTLNPAAGPKVELSFLDELRSVHRDGFSAVELQEAKKAFLNSRIVARSNDAALLNLILLHEQLNRPFTWDENFEAAIRRLTVDEVNAAFRKHIDPNGVSIVKAGDFKAAGVFQ
jgi:zinc protease